jgi:hypothetical protein
MYKILIGKSNRKRPLGRPRCRWKENIKTDFKKVGYRHVDWTDTPQYSGQ